MEGHDRQRYKAWHRMMMMMMIVANSIVMIVCVLKMKKKFIWRNEFIIKKGKF